MFLLIWVRIFLGLLVGDGWIHIHFDTSKFGYLHTKLVVDAYLHVCSLHCFAFPYFIPKNLMDMFYSGLRFHFFQTRLAFRWMNAEKFLVGLWVLFPTPPSIMLHFGSFGCCSPIPWNFNSCAFIISKQHGPCTCWLPSVWYVHTEEVKCIFPVDMFLLLIVPWNYLQDVNP